MKILHITNNYPSQKYPIFGIFVKEQIETLTELGIENEVFFVNGFENGKIEYIKGALHLRKYLKINHFDLIHCHHALSAFMYMLMFEFIKKPCVVSFQNDPINEHGLVLYKFIKKKFDAFIFKNNSTLIKELNGRGIYLPNGVNTDFFKPMDKTEAKKMLNLDLSKKYILFVSSFVLRKQKRIDRFDNTIKILKEEYPEENYEELKLINVERKYMPYYFNAVSLHLMTSDFEGSPNSVKESICCNTPVVSTNVGNVKDMLFGAENCFVSDDFSPRTLAELVQKISVAQKLVEIYERVLKK